MNLAHLSLLSAAWILVELLVLYVEAADKPVPALFIFGDSFVDSGNNNVLETLAKANFPPYGGDFDYRRPTGRFANGRLIPDFFASFLGLPFQPPYATAGDDVLSGVNFASAGSGLVNSTGYIFGEHIPIPQQVENFRTVKDKLMKLVGVKSASDIVSKAIYYITVGSNDISNNYYVLPGTPIQQQYTPAQFQDLLVSIYSQQLQALYSLGARKIVVKGLIPLGCTPVTLLEYDVQPGDCVKYLNEAAKSYNAAIESLLSQLRSSLLGVQIVYSKAYDVIYDIIQNPKNYVSNKACCSGVGKNGAVLFCLQNVPYCKNPREYVYWDEFHPSSAIYELLANRFWSGSQDYSFPINVKALAYS
ncbi:hypothetical protein O6H91_12G098500 [Diphasiastrum complanatum]|uniref:Uncharacterized protein n=1 Tax=Diphasiastrum complanatum TaxID=34168 RepID=A0ACC2C566_DIPCM|nr:hypothetical protein O6H91_12G098500 [Diphasiastrum complanatum]